MTHTQFLSKYPTQQYNYVFHCISCDLERKNGLYNGSIHYQWNIFEKITGKSVASTFPEWLQGSFNMYNKFNLGKGLDGQVVNLACDVLPYNQHYEVCK